MTLAALPRMAMAAVPLNGVLDDETRNVIAAFQMRFRPDRFDGEPDLETAALLLAVPTS